ncbi:MAG: VOC family protein [Chloroflexi bacterium]|nr:VOC family protein [Chloroflexota bacterium]
MLFDAIDMVILPVSDLDAASAQFERLGLFVSPTTVNESRASAFRLIPFGGPDNLFCIELLSVADPSATTPFVQGFGNVADRGLSQLNLLVSDTDAVLAELGKHGISAATKIAGGQGKDRYDVTILEPLLDAATTLGLIQYGQSMAERHAAFASQGRHTFPAKRLDHLAAVAPDLDASCRYWDEVLGVPTVGEVVSPVIVVRQVKIGDAIFELLGPSSPDSPIRQRPPGLGSSVSLEVPDLHAAIAQARAAGFDVPDHRIGTLPGTIVTQISADQLSGLTMQLLQYV